MKVLVRNHNGQEYVWKEATYKNSLYIVKGYSYGVAEIVSVMDDDRGNLVKCSACGEYFTKDSPEIEKHKNRYKDINTCFKCDVLYCRPTGDNKTTYEQMDDESYNRVVKTPCNLSCDHGWYTYPIGSPEAQEGCKHKPCATATMLEIEDIFTKHPGIFDDLATVDKVVEIGYKSVDGNNYKLNGRNNIVAHVNSVGIVDHFTFHYGSDWFNLVYSKKLDKLFNLGYYNYEEWNPDWLSESTKTYVKNKIAELYN